MTERDRKLYISQRLARSKAVIAEIDNLIKFEYLNTAINRIYYSCFYSVQALLASLDLYPKSHAGILRMFSLHFTKKGKIPTSLSEYYTGLFHKRQLADYAEGTEYKKEEAEKLFSTAIDFITYVEKLLEEK